MLKFEDLEREIRDFFSHNPDENEVGIVVLGGTDLGAVHNEDDVFIDISDVTIINRGGL